jgi:hypothetical protein
VPTTCAQLTPSAPAAPPSQFLCYKQLKKSLKQLPDTSAGACNSLGDAADTAGTTLMRASAQACPPCWAGLASRVEHALALVLAVSRARLDARRCFWCATGPEGADNGASAAAAEHKHELTPAEREFVRALNSVRGSSALAAVWSTVV